MKSSSIGNLSEFLSVVEDTSRNLEKLLDLVKAFVRENYSSKNYVERKYSYGVVLKKGFKKLIVVGDLHGDFNTLVTILRREKIIEDIDDKVIVFLGDYIDRGYNQIETIVSVYLLKTLFPGNVVVLRGNHEPPPHLIPYPHDFPEILYWRFGEDWSRVYRFFMNSFQKIPLFAILPGEAFFVHGGPPRTLLYAETLDEALNTPLPDDVVIEEILWSDPIERTDISYEPSYRGAGILYGWSIVENTLKKAGVKTIIRSHEPVPGGIRIGHRGHVITVFTSKVYGLGTTCYLSIDQGVVDPGNVEYFVRRL